MLGRFDEWLCVFFADWCSYHMVTMPVSGNNAQYSKEGRASCWSFFSLVATGNCSVEKAAKSGGVTKIKMVSRETNNFLGIVGKYTTIVQGD
ncbi:hypothetical protein HpCS36_10970 [Helicobacter pylori]